MKFYKEVDGSWVFCNSTIPSGMYYMNVVDNIITISPVIDNEDLPRFKGVLNDIEDKSGNKYSSIENLRLSVNDFFVKAPSIGALSEYSKNIYTEYVSKTISNTSDDISLLSSPLTLKTGSIKPGKVLRLRIFGKYSSLVNEISRVSILLNGSAVILSNLNRNRAFVDSMFITNIVFTFADNKLIISGTSSIYAPDEISQAYSRIIYNQGVIPFLYNRDNIIDIMHKWGVASTGNSVTIDSYTFELI